MPLFGLVHPQEEAPYHNINNFSPLKCFLIFHFMCEKHSGNLIWSDKVQTWAHHASHILYFTPAERKHETLWFNNKWPSYILEQQLQALQTSRPHGFIHTKSRWFLNVEQLMFASRFGVICDPEFLMTTSHIPPFFGRSEANKYWTSLSTEVTEENKHSTCYCVICSCSVLNMDNIFYHITCNFVS